jgi:hypothetical protein
MLSSNVACFKDAQLPIGGHWSLKGQGRIAWVNAWMSDSSRTTAPRGNELAYVEDTKGENNVWTSKPHGIQIESKLGVVLLFPTNSLLGMGCARIIRGTDIGVYWTLFTNEKQWKAMMTILFRLELLRCRKNYSDILHYLEHSNPRQSTHTNQLAKRLCTASSEFMKCWLSNDISYDPPWSTAL